MTILLDAANCISTASSSPNDDDAAVDGVSTPLRHDFAGVPTVLGLTHLVISFLKLLATDTIFELISEVNKGIIRFANL
jgi:hypothetical protein